ncbi:efflux RND transporter permease subunit [Neptunomonas japonica]|uniref:RND family efflux transporter integral membrane protein n=1 Tax=Neptunomonas japonica JAMM 1380 TaxID=1441457 RepID=A0A7R6PMB0_9GAMM|nr:efflux RND transporter permease subunit [Neptunomonas japonica]BBB30806.1 RND family efflux transporter integral membrane protein [Neptunomonas japonica JAMM 1380]
MIRYFAGHPTAANILMVVIILLGLVALPQLNKETFPEIKLNKVSVTVAYPGASPADVEEGLCNRLEDATDGLSFLDEQMCEARDSLATLTLEMQEAGDIKQFVDDVNAAIDGINDFPDKAEDPVVKELGRTEAVLSIAVTANNTMPELKALAEYYRNRLLALPEIPIVTVTDFSEHELSVRVKPDAMRQYQLSIQDVANLISAQAVDLPAGVLEGSQNSYQIRVENTRRTVTELEDLVILDNDKGGQITLGDIATIQDDFAVEEQRTELNGIPAALIQISKNKTDDTLRIYNAAKKFIDQENARLPEGTSLIITQDSASIVQDRLSLLMKNGWQGLLLATLALFMFFSWRYTFWVALGLPISFLGGLVIMSTLGVSINMISMVALLMAIGILMDDAIVLSESIDHEYRKGKSPFQASIDGVKKVARGVFSSFVTSAMLFGSLLFLKGDMGQVLGVLPVVLLAVLSISLIEAFLILPHHLQHSLAHHSERQPSQWRNRFEAKFEKLRARVGTMADTAIRYRYLTVGFAIVMLIISISLIISGTLKFKGFPDIEGNRLEVRVLMPQGTPFSRTQEVVSILTQSLNKTLQQLPAETEGKLVKNTAILYSRNDDAHESGAHLATISLDLLDAEKRNTSLVELKRRWRELTPQIRDAISIQFKEPKFGPSGQAISIRLQGNNLDTLYTASWELQNWLKGYSGTSNIMSDIRPGKTEFKVQLQAGAISSGIDVQGLSSQLRAAYQGVKVSDIYRGSEAYEINVMLDSQPENALNDFENITLFSKNGVDIPLKSIADIEEGRQYSRIVRINHQRTVTVSGDVNTQIANTNEIIGHTRNEFLPQLKARYPDLVFSLEGEVKNDSETSGSVLTGFILGIAGVYLLLSLQFANFKEPIIVLLNIPLALIGVIWGHFLMGLDLSLPSMIGFVSLAGVVVNDSILLVEFVKARSMEGMNLHDAAGQAVRDRFRAIFLTSITTVAGMIPLLSETSLQAQVLVPLVASVVFGMLSATLLLLLVLPASYAILEDLGFTELDSVGDDKPTLAIPA